MTMKNTIIKYVAAGLALVALSACHNAEYAPLSGVGSGVAFIAQTQTQAYASQGITLGMEEVFVETAIRLTDPAAEDCSFTLAKDATALEKFNKRKSTTYVPLPDDFFSITDAEDNPVTQVKVLKGQSMSSSLRVHVKPLTDEMVDSGLKYAIPVTLKSQDAKVEVLESAASMVYVLNRLPIQDVPKVNTNSKILGMFNGKVSTFTQWTWEVNVNMDQLGTGIGQLNNQAILNVTLSGNEIYVRFGDAPIEGNRLQIKTQGTQFESQTLFNINTWYHIAFVCNGSQVLLYINGQLDNSLDVGGNSYTLDENGGDGGSNFQMASSGSYFKANAMFAEMRFWSVARSQAEIQNNMYSCDPASEGLMCYYKFNEGTGTSFTDYSLGAEEGAGRAHAATDFPWIPDVRIDGK